MNVEKKATFATIANTVMRWPIGHRRPVSIMIKNLQMVYHHHLVERADEQFKIMLLIIMMDELAESAVDDCETVSVDGPGIIDLCEKVENHCFAAAD